MDLGDRVALITGATSGLGAVTALMLANEGVHIAITHRGHRDEGIAVCRQVAAKGRKNFLVHLDQTDVASCGAAVETTVKELGRLDIVINNAAVNEPVPFNNLHALSPETPHGPRRCCPADRALLRIRLDHRSSASD